MKNKSYAELKRDLRIALLNGGEGDSLVRCLRADMENHPDYKEADYDY